MTTRTQNLLVRLAFVGVVLSGFLFWATVSYAVGRAIWSWL